MPFGAADMDVQLHRFTWRSIEIEVRYMPFRWGVIAHLEITSVAPARAPLPITDTGYRSHFHQPNTVESLGGEVVAQVVAWLDAEATSPDWKAYESSRKQLSLL